MRAAQHPFRRALGALRRSGVTAAVATALATAGAVLAAGCGDAARLPTETSVPPELRRAAAVPDSLAIQAVVGGEAWVTGPARDSLGAPPSTPVTFASADPSVAAVDSLGQIVGVRVGRTAVTARAGGRTVAIPVVVRLVRFTTVSVGAPTCAATDVGEAVCRGDPINETTVKCYYGGHGQICSSAGGGRPMFLATRERFRAMLPGQCGLTRDGRVVCWRRTACDEITNGRCRMVYNTTAGAQPYVAATQSFDGTCGLRADGVAECWGENRYGTAGTGTLGVVASPTPVAGGLRFRRVVQGTLRACGLVEDGTAWCWGQITRRAQLSGNWNDASPAPTAAPVGNLRFRDVTGDQCGVTTAGEAVCWTYEGEINRPAPGLTFATINGQCGLTADGAVYCWDFGSTETGVRPTPPTRIPSPVPWRTLDGNGADLCGMGTDGAAYCALWAPFGIGAGAATRVPGQG